MQLAVAGFIWPLSKLPKTFYLLPPSSILESRGMWVFVRSRILAILAPFWTGIQLFSIHILKMILITVKEIRYSRKLAVLATQVFPLSPKWNARTIKYTSTSSPFTERKPHKYQMLVFSHLTFTFSCFRVLWQTLVRFVAISTGLFAFNSDQLKKIAHRIASYWTASSRNTNIHDVTLFSEYRFRLTLFSQQHFHICVTEMLISIMSTHAPKPISPFTNRVHAFSDPFAIHTHTHRHLSIKVLLLLQQQMLFEFPFDLQ